MGIVAPAGLRVLRHSLPSMPGRLHGAREVQIRERSLVSQSVNRGGLILRIA